MFMNLKLYNHRYFNDKNNQKIKNKKIKHF